MDNSLEENVDSVNIIKGDDSKYWGKYVAISCSQTGKVVAYGRRLGRVIENAVKREGKGNFFTTKVHHPDEAYAGG